MDGGWVKPFIPMLANQSINQESIWYSRVMGHTFSSVSYNGRRAKSEKGNDRPRWKPAKVHEFKRLLAHEFFLIWVGHLSYMFDWWLMRCCVHLQSGNNSFFFLLNTELYTLKIYLRKCNDLFEFFWGGGFFFLAGRLCWSWRISCRRRGTSWTTRSTRRWWRWWAAICFASSRRPIRRITTRKRTIRRWKRPGHISRWGGGRARRAVSQWTPMFAHLFMAHCVFFSGSFCRLCTSFSCECWNPGTLIHK